MFRKTSGAHWLKLGLLVVLALALGVTRPALAQDRLPPDSGPEPEGSAETEATAGPEVTAEPEETAASQDAVEPEGTVEPEEAVVAGSPAVPGEMVVQFKRGTSEDEVARAAAEIGATVTSYEPDVGLALFTLEEEGARVKKAQVARALEASPKALAASPNYIYSISPLAGGQAGSSTPTSRPVQARSAVTGQALEVSVPISPPDDSEQGLGDLLSSLGESLLPGVFGKGSKSSQNNDPHGHWGWYATDSDGVWLDATQAVEIAIVDTGADFTHPEFGKGKLIAGRDWVNADTDPKDDHGHGTHVAGIAVATANNGIGIAGMSNGSAYVIKVINAQGWGTTFDIAMGIYEAANRDSVKVINLSLGGPDSPVLEDAVDYAVNTKGKLLVIAAGNSDEELDCGGTWPDADTHYPACYRADSSYEDGIIVVAASGNDEEGNGNGWIDGDTWEDWRAETRCQGAHLGGGAYSNYGGYVDIIAPGTDILSTVPGYPVDGGYWETWGAAGALGKKSKGAGAYWWFDGTSMAAPHVAGAAARAWAKQLLTDPSTDALDVKNRLLDESQDVDEDACWPVSAPDPSHDRPFLWSLGSMQLAVIAGYVFDADTGATIPGTQFQAVRSGATLAQDAVCSDPWCGFFALRAVPLSGTDWVGVQVSESSHTNGFQSYLYWDVIEPGWYWWTYISLPPKVSNRWSFVTTWDDDAYDLDGYLFLPPGAVDGSMCNPYEIPPCTPPSVTWVGPDWVPVGITQLEDSTVGELTTDPYARLMYESSSSWDFLIESTAAIPGPVPQYVGEYTYIVAEYGGAPVEKLERGSCSHVWNNGTIIYSTCRPYDSGATEPFWVVGILNVGPSGALTFYAIDVLAYDIGVGTPEYDDYTGSRTFSAFGGGGGRLAPHPPR